MTSSDNRVASTLKIIAYLTYIGGFVLGLILARESVDVGTYYRRTETVFSFSTALIYWYASFVTGTFTLGFAELIRLSQLQADIADSMNVAIRNLAINQPPTTTQAPISPATATLKKPTPSQSRKNSASEFDLNKWKSNNI